MNESQFRESFEPNVLTFVAVLAKLLDEESGIQSDIVAVEEIKEQKTA